ncbi:MAG: integrase [Blastopirellula sp.]|nr:MAG: integrase [Blastopirellula sp.]
MATIEKRVRKTGTFYRVRVRVKGLPEIQKTFTRRTDAKLYAQEAETAIRKGQLPEATAPVKGKTLKSVTDRYRAEILPHKATTTQRVENTFLNYWEKELGQYALTYISAEAITERMHQLALAGDSRRKYSKGQRPNKPKSRKTLKHYRDFIGLLFRYACQWGWTMTDPTEAVNKVTKIGNGSMRFLSPEEREKLLSACKESHNPQLYPIVIFALATGTRKSEILGLTLADIHPDRDAATLHNTKNGETRTVYIIDHLKSLIVKKMVAVNLFYDGIPEYDGKRWLFPRSDGLQPIDIRKAWENARAAAGLDDFRFHDLRHTAASYLAMNGANMLEIAEVLGHKTLQMVKRYSHLSDNHVKNVVQTMNKDLF